MQALEERALLILTSGLPCLGRKCRYSRTDVLVEPVSEFLSILVSAACSHPEEGLHISALSSEHRSRRHVLNDREHTVKAEGEQLVV